MKDIRIALLGYGNVGKALIELCKEKKAELNENYGVDFLLSGIATKSHGCMIYPNGIHLNEFVETRTLLYTPGAVKVKGVEQFIQDCQAAILVESIPVNYENGQPALDYIGTALTMGLHVVTANKGPVVHGFDELSAIAKGKGVKFLFESTVLDGTPIFSLFRETLPLTRVTGFEGVLNSTTNLILTLMEKGKSFQDAVSYCQEIGIAETDPSGDIDGWDAAVKVALLCTVLMDASIKPQDVVREGIRNIDLESVQGALNEGRRWKLICRATKGEGKVRAIVKPETVTPDSPCYHLDGTSSLISFKTNTLEGISIVGANPSTRTTAYGIYSDLVSIANALA